MDLQGGEYIASGKFKCLFDNRDYLSYLVVDASGGVAGEDHLSCLDGFAAVIAESRELDKEQVFDELLRGALSKDATRMIYATMALLPSRRYTLSPAAIARFAVLAAHSKQPNCMDLFKSPSKLQAVCMNRGTPLSGSDVIPTVWASLSGSSVGPSPELAAPLLGELLGDVALGLKVLLDADILHGDIKMNNVLLFQKPQPIRAWEIEPVDPAKGVSARSEKPVGQRAFFQIIDFGKHQTKAGFVKGGFRAFTRKNMRLWYNPLCLGLALADAAHVPKASETVDDASTGTGSSDLRRDGRALRHEELSRWLPEVFGQIDKYAFMYVVWQLGQSAALLGKQADGAKWKSTEFFQSLLSLIQYCVAPFPDDLVERAANRVSLETQLHDHPFRKHMMTNKFMWFKSWPAIYRVVRSWSKYWNVPLTKKLIPRTMGELANNLCPGIL